MPKLRNDLFKYAALKSFVQKDNPTLYDFILNLLDATEKRDLLFEEETNTEAA